jgi:hypothetical protein
MTIILIQRAFLTFFFEIIYFPVWWYTGGVIFAVQTAKKAVYFGVDALSPLVWWKYLLVPMYGEYSWQGRIISFFVRLLQGILRSVLCVVWIGIVGSLVLGWLVLPLVTVRGLMKGLLHP